jgi:hypothetical protein
LGKKNLMEKFGFSDDEEEDVVQLAREADKKRNSSIAIEA